MPRIANRGLTRNEERSCWISAATYDHYERPTRYTTRLILASDLLERGCPISDPWRDRWEPSRHTLMVMARRLSPHGAPLGGTKAHRRALRRRRIQRVRRMGAPMYDSSECPF